jgi:hypothetical protein
MGRGDEDETVENRGIVCLGPSAPVVGPGTALQEQWPQMVAPHKEKPPSEQRSSREARSSRLKTQNSASVNQQPSAPTVTLFRVALSTDE